MLKKASPLLLLLICLNWLGCNSAPPTLMNTTTSTQPNQASQRDAQPSSIEKTIWKGESGGMPIEWTTVDLYAQSAAGTESVFAPLVKKGFEDFAAVQVEGDQPETAQTIKQGQVEGCEYGRDFEVLSVVGTLVSFEDQYHDHCGGSHPSADTRFTTVDLAKPGQVLYARGKDTPMMNVDPANLGKVVKLTDYFAEQNILRALLADPVIKKALANLDASVSPQTLTELIELCAKDDYELGDSGFELRPDFLTRFAFHHVEGDKVAVRIGLPPHYGANRTQHQQLGLLLPIPPALQQPFALAATRQEGFLMKDAPKIAGNQATKFNFRMSKSMAHRS